MMDLIIASDRAEGGYKRVFTKRVILDYARVINYCNNAQKRALSDRGFRGVSNEASQNDLKPFTAS